MSEEKKWKKINEKKYQRMTADGEWVNIDVPYGKVELIFAEFIGLGGMIDGETGAVTTDVVTMISSLSSVGDLLLSEFDPQGELITKGSCKGLATSEVPVLFEIATDIIQNFIQVIATMKGAGGMTSGEKEKAPKETKTTA